MTNTTLLLIVGIFIITLIMMLRRERFTSPGTMVQLATSHVPTAEDYYFYKNIYPKMVRSDITDMTGGDPGPILPYYPA